MKSVQNKILILILASLLLIGGILFFITKPEIDSYKKHKTEYINKQEELATTLDKLEILQKNGKNGATLKNTLLDVTTLWPDNPDVSKFIVQTEQLAKEKQFVIENFSISEKKIQKKSATEESTDSAKDTDTAKSAKAPTLTQYSFNASVPFPTALDIVRSMERLARFNDINLLNLTSQAGQDGNIINLTLTGTLHYGK